MRQRARSRGLKRGCARRRGRPWSRRRPRTTDDDDDDDDNRRGIMRRVAVLGDSLTRRGQEEPGGWCGSLAAAYAGRADVVSRCWP
ncbi:MAG: hypothetical protein CMJ31_04135 [Phycisphaerae bacterium]|nr:hypothetical protein [Phycisphaerae bacterium]